MKNFTNVMVGDSMYVVTENSKIYEITVKKRENFYFDGIICHIFEVDNIQHSDFINNKMMGCSFVDEEIELAPTGRTVIILEDELHNTVASDYVFQNQELKEMKSYLLFASFNEAINELLRQNKKKRAKFLSESYLEECFLMRFS